MSAAAVGRRDDARPSTTSRSPASACRSPSSAGSAASRAPPRASTPSSGLLDAELAERIAAAGDEVADGDHDDQFPIDVFQTGSGTSSNMNANEVHRQPRRRGRAPQRPRQHGPVVQRRVPERRAPRRARARPRTRCCPRSRRSRPSLQAKADEFTDIVKAGRTHLMDAVPVTLGQEFAGYAAQIRLGASRVAQRAARRSPRSRSAAPPPAPASTPTRSSPSASARKLVRGDRPDDLRRRRTRSRRRPTATRSSSSPAR